MAYWICGQGTLSQHVGILDYCTSTWRQGFSIFKKWGGYALKISEMGVGASYSVRCRCL